jgi:hypothetical protein
MSITNRINTLIVKLIEYKQLMINLPDIDIEQREDFLYRNKEILLACDALSSEITHLMDCVNTGVFHLSDEEKEIKLLRFLLIMGCLGSSEEGEAIDSDGHVR